MRRHIGRIIGAAAAAALLVALPASAAPRHSGARRASTFAAPTRAARASAVRHEPSPVGPEGYATYNGQTIDLAQGWDGAKACAAYANGATECFSSADAMYRSIGAYPTVQGGTISSAQLRGHARALARRALARLRSFRLGTSARAVGHGAYCQANWEWLYLYQNINYGGTVLALQITDYWYDLWDYGFGDQLSSYINDTACYFYGVQNGDGSGAYIFGNPWEAESYVGNAVNDLINYIYISS
ncbi:MAG TPA: hypothetical protein VKV23_00020 [Acidimicrobiales bacterium]|nr:hypothetical protein [Acidimicrobiales bacterium]